MRIYIGKCGDANFDYFLKFPQEIYSPGSLRLKQKEIISKEYESDYFLVFDKNNIACARAVLYKNNELRYLDEKAYCIGNYECIDNGAISDFLWKNIFLHIKTESIRYIIGPMNGSTWEQYRFNLSTDALFFTEYEHKEYYIRQFESAGFKSIASYTSNLDDGLTYDKNKAKELEVMLAENGVVIRKLNMNDFEEELKRIYFFSLESFKNNFLYTTVSWESFYEKYIPVKSIINPDFVLLAEREGELKGLFFGIQDLLSTTGKRLIVKTIARNPDSIYDGLAYVMADKVLTEAKNAGFTSAIHAFIHQDNKSKSFSYKFSGKQYKEYALYAFDTKK